MMHHDIKSDGDSSKAKSNTCRSDTYLVISNFDQPQREVSMWFILVMIVSSFSSRCVTQPGCSEEVSLDPCVLCCRACDSVIN